MKQHMQKLTALSLAWGMALAPAVAQTSAPVRKKTASPRSSRMEREMQQVLDQLKQQQQEINTLQQQLQTRDQQLQAAQQAAH